MSDSNVENTNSENNKDEETSASDKKPSLTSLTHKLKAEALRRYKINEELNNEAEEHTSLDSTQDAIDVDSYKVKEQGLNSLSQLDSIEQRDTTEPKSNLQSGSLSVNDTLSSVNQKELNGPTVEQNTDVANPTQPNKDHENQNYTSDNIEDSEASKRSNQRLQISDSINDQTIESGDHHIVASSEGTAPESLVPNESNTTDLTEEGIIEDKYHPVEGNKNILAVSAETSNEDDDEKHVEYSEKNKHGTQSSGDNDSLQSNVNQTSYDNGSEPIDSFSEIDQSKNAISDQVQLISSSPNKDANPGPNIAQISEADEVIQPTDMGSGGTKLEELSRNDHSTEVGNNEMSIRKEEPQPVEKITSSEVTHQQNASLELETHSESTENNLASAAKQNEGNQSDSLEQTITSTTSNTGAVLFQGNKALCSKCINGSRKERKVFQLWFAVRHIDVFLVY